VTRETAGTRLGIASAILVAATAIVAAGCGGSSRSADEQVARLDTTAPAETSTAPAETTGEDPQEAAIAWARCMREQGIDVPDPQVSNGRVIIRPRGGPGDVDPDEFEAAREKCGTPFGATGPPELSEEDRRVLQEAALEFAKCMRAEGIDMPDPDFSGSGGMFRFGGPNSGIDPDDPDFQAASEKCRPIMERALADAGLERGPRRSAP
jgi:hypothetical protein